MDKTTGNIPIFEKNDNDTVNNPKHYRSIGARCSNCNVEIECIDVTRKLDFDLGNAIKYIWRANFKGNAVQDISKAMWYLQDFLINYEEKK